MLLGNSQLRYPINYSGLGHHYSAHNAIRLKLTYSFLLCSDNLMTDIYGANLYGRYLAQQQALTTPNKVVAQAMGTPVEAGHDLLSSADECRSILVGFWIK